MISFDHNIASALRSSVCSLGVAVLLGGITASSALAEPFTGSYTFTTSAAGNVTSYAYNGTSIPDIAVSDLTKVGVETRGSSGAFVARGWTTGAIHFENTFTGGIDMEDYFEFTLTASEGADLSLTSLAFGLSRDATGPRQFEWRSSVDGFTTTISSYSALSVSLTQSGGVITAPDASTGHLGNVLDLTGSEFVGHESVTFRLYAYNAEATTGMGGLSGSLSFTAEAVTAVPEPSTYSLILGAGAVVFLLARRRNANV